MATIDSAAAAELEKFQTQTPEPDLSRQRIRRSVGPILWLIPPILILGLLCRYAVDVPVWDDFTILDSVHKIIHKGFTLERLVVQHNEGRPAFPRLLIWMLYGPTQWDVRYLMAVSFVVIFCTAGLMLRICFDTIDNPKLAMAAAVLVNFMLFSPVQWQNLLWAMELTIFIPALSLAIIMLCLRSARPFYLTMPIAAIAAVFANYSCSNGLLVWLLAIPFFLIHPSKFRVRALICWLVLAAIFIGYYFHGYEKPPQMYPLSLALHDLKGALNFTLAFLGNGVRICKEPDLDTRLGWAAVAVWGAGAICVAIFGRRGQLWHKALPWVTLGVYSIASAVLATLGRFGFGPAAAIAERYCSFAIPLWFSIAPLWLIIICQLMPRETWIRKLSTSLAVLGGLAVLVLWFMGCIYIQTELRAYRAQLLASRSLEQFMRVAPDDDAIRAILFPAPKFAKQVIAYSDDADVFHPQCFRTNDISSIAAIDNRAVSGYFDALSPQGDRLLLTGWACIPPRMTPADAVLLTTPDAAGVERVFAIVCETRLDRPDIASITHCPALKESGWTKTIAKDRLPTTALISAWAFDTYSRRAYRLGGAHQIP